MKRQDFHYHLPPELIAERPPAQRRDSRLLCLDGASGAVRHGRFPDLLELVRPGDLMVFNDTRVIPARCFARKASGGRVEVLLERVLDERRALAHLRASRAPRPGTELILDEGTAVTVEERQEDLFQLGFPPGRSVLEVLKAAGEMPLPPYIQRPAEELDSERYQTVYARREGAVAAPTAGLHFDDELLQRLEAKGVESAFVTLHVGAGTFQPVRVEDIREHPMHSEVMEIAPEVCQKVIEARARGGRVIAVGTTSVRCLETAALNSAEGGEIRPFQGETDIFIYPGYRFRAVDALITNFHLPESSLLMLVAAFAGYPEIMAAYRAAVEECYRFFSYGDAMFITRNPRPRGPESAEPEARA